MSFFKLSTYEKRLLVIRRHWWIIFREALIVVFLVIVLIYAVFFISSSEVASKMENIKILKIFFSLLILFIGWMSFFIIWVKYYLDAWIITNRRIIDIEQHTFFFRDVSEFRVDRIQDITVEVRGFLPTILDYGHLHVQTAGKSRDFTFSFTPNPYKVRDIISEASNESLKKRFDDVFNQDI